MFDLPKGKKSLSNFYILNVLKNYSSKDKPMTQANIIEKVNKDYEISLTRKTVGGYLTDFKDAGYVEGKRGFYAKNRFSDTELKFLIDSVLFSKHIPQDNAKILIEKLRDMGSGMIKLNGEYSYYLPKLFHTDIKTIYNNIENMYEAINKQKKIKITLCRNEVFEEGTNKYSVKNIDKKEQVVSPFYIVTSNGRYYLLCYFEDRYLEDKDKDLESRRIDRISKVEVLNENRIDIRDLKKYSNGSFDLSEYINKNVYLYSGRTEKIELEIKRYNMSDFIDWYGKNFDILKVDEEKVLVKINANVNATIFWAMQYGDKVKIISPESVLSDMRKKIENMMEKYK